MIKNWKLIKTCIAGVLAAGAITFGVLAGIKTANTVKYANEVNECTNNKNTLMQLDTAYEYNTPGTENYNKVTKWEEEIKEANEKYNEYEKNLMLYASLSFLCIFGLVYLGVDSLRKK